MGKISLAIISAILGGAAAAIAVLAMLGWGKSNVAQLSHVDPTRSDYIDLILTLTTVLLGAVGLAVTVGALVIGLVALKTLREIKDEARKEAKDVAGAQIKSTMETQLEPKVHAKLNEALPSVLPAVLLNNEVGYRILTQMAERGELDVIFERVAARLQDGSTELDLDQKDG